MVEHARRLRARARIFEGTGWYSVAVSTLGFCFPIDFGHDIHHSLIAYVAPALGLSLGVALVAWGRQLRARVAHWVRAVEAGGVPGFAATRAQHYDAALVESLPRMRRGGTGESVRRVFLRARREPQSEPSVIAEVLGSVPYRIAPDQPLLVVAP